jgi:o-succinylbenzoate---CoA ligase
VTDDPVARSPSRTTPGGDDALFRPLPGGTRPDRVSALLGALRLSLSGHAPKAAVEVSRPDDASPAILVPHADGDDGASVVAALRSRLRREIPAGTAVVLQTSGSTTGTGHLVALTADSLVASARATEQRLAGPGQWLLAVPAHHVAGLQVLVRSVVAGTTPVVVETTDGFDPRALASAVAGMRADLPGYLSLVPTQLVRVLEGGEEVVAPLRHLAAVLVGGAATAPRALDEARSAGLRVVTTYGMTETGGGCVYDGVPLPGVRLRLTGEDARVEVAGPVLAAGYLDDPAADADTFRAEDGVRWLRTSDRAALVQVDDPARPLRLRVLGRVDDLINTGGIKVSPGSVERVLAEHSGVAEVAVVAVPDEEWGELVTAVVVAAAGQEAPRLPELRGLVTSRLGGAHAPRALVVLTSLPLRGPGKIDRRGTALIAAEALGATEAPAAPASTATATAPANHTTAPATTALVRAERHDHSAQIS